MDALFGIPNTGESVQEIPIKQLHSFRDHPFRAEPDEKMIESVREYGILSPLLARKKVEGEYEIISGHRRKAAAEQIGLDKLPVFVRDLTDEEAIILMVDSNIQRENLLPSEKAFAFLDDYTLAIGVVDRTNWDAIANIREQMEKFGYRPFWHDHDRGGG